VLTPLDGSEGGHAQSNDNIDPVANFVFGNPPAARALDRHTALHGKANVVIGNRGQGWKRFVLTVSFRCLWIFLARLIRLPLFKPTKIVELLMTLAYSSGEIGMGR
jgi:hypothetical protein